MTKPLHRLNALRAFEAAGRLGRMTAAAGELHVTPGAISRQVKQLEDALGVTLFEGAKNQPRLSTAGERLLTPLSAAFRQIEQAVDAVQVHERSTLDVCCLGSFSLRWLIPRLYDFHARDPQLEVRLSASDFGAPGPTVRHDVVIDVMDAQHATAHPLADATLLFPEALGPVLAPALAQRLQLTHLADLQRQPILQTRTRTNAWAMWQAAAGVQLPMLPGSEFGHYYFTLEAAANGLGVCISPWHLVVDDVRAGRLVAPFGFALSGYHYVARYRAPTRDAARRFGSWLQAQAAAMEAAPAHQADDKVT